MRITLRNTLLLITFALSLTVKATNENFPVGADAAAQGGFSVVPSNIWSVFNNQAGLANLKSITAGLAIENRFFLSELSIGSLGAALPTKSGTFGLSIQQFGFSSYSESRYGLAYGRNIGEKISAGLQINYLSTSFPENYGRINGFTAEFGVIAKLNDKLTLGSHIYNINRYKLPTVSNKNPEYVPTVIKIGLQYQVSSKINIMSEISKPLDQAFILRLGTSYMPNDKLFLRVGMATNPNTFHFGFGYQIKSFKLDMAAAYHQILGFIPQASFIWELDAKKN